MGDSISFDATRMVYGDDNQPKGFEVYTYDSDQDLITVFNVDRDGTLTGSYDSDSLSITESLGITINPINDAPVVDGLLRPLGPGNENTDYQIELGDLTNNISDVDSDEETFTVVNLIRFISRLYCPNRSERQYCWLDFYAICKLQWHVELNYQVTDSTGLFVQNEAGNPQNLAASFSIVGMNDAPERIAGALNDVTAEEDAGLVVSQPRWSRVLTWSQRK